MKYVLAAVAIIVTAIAVPNFRTARERSRQKRTMADIRTIAVAWDAFAEDTHTYSVRDVRRALEPTYVRHFPPVDGWGTPFELAAKGNHYSIRSYGSDRRRDSKIVPGGNPDFARDILYEDATFIAYPEGI